MRWPTEHQLKLCDGPRGFRVGDRDSLAQRGVKVPLSADLQVAGGQLQRYRSRFDTVAYRFRLASINQQVVLREKARVAQAKPVPVGARAPHCAIAAGNREVAILLRVTRLPD